MINSAGALNPNEFGNNQIRRRHASKRQSLSSPLSPPFDSHNIIGRSDIGLTGHYYYLPRQKRPTPSSSEQSLCQHKSNSNRDTNTHARGRRGALLHSHGRLLLISSRRAARKVHHLTARVLHQSFGCCSIHRPRPFGWLYKREHRDGAERYFGLSCRYS